MAVVLDPSRPLDRLLSEYGESHQNPLNKAIHYFCVPAIFWTVLALLSYVAPPPALGVPGFVNGATVVAVLGLIYYFTLSPALGVAGAALVGLCFLINWAWPSQILPLWQGAIGVFAIAWIFQFVGHGVEGKRPSFLTDLRFLLIGPAWTMKALLGRVGIAV